MSFSSKLIRWYQRYGRHDLPWQKKPTPYRVWISEIMLQQTQVATVIPYYQQFMQRFPSLSSLAGAHIDEVLSYWSGLGYYARARNLHKTAQIISKEHGGRFPRSVEALTKLPGIGASTGGAIASFSMQLPATILDGNVKRVLTRYFAIEGWPGETKINQQLWSLAEKLTPKNATHLYNQAIMDLGATICTRTKPKCELCPFCKECDAKKHERVLDFPYRKKIKQRPTQHIHMLLMKTEQGKFLLERRPPTGIWGGLWAFPECSLDEDIEKYCLKNFHVKASLHRTWDTIYHKFSHFNLEIQPLFLNVNISKSFVMDSNQYFWYKLSNSLPGGISAPVKKLISQLRSLYEPNDLL